MAGKRTRYPPTNFPGSSALVLPSLCYTMQVNCLWRCCWLAASLLRARRFVRLHCVRSIFLYNSVLFIAAHSSGVWRSFVCVCSRLVLLVFVSPGSTSLSLAEFYTIFVLLHISFSSLPGVCVYVCQRCTTTQHSLRPLRWLDLFHSSVI